MEETRTEEEREPEEEYTPVWKRGSGMCCGYCGIPMVPGQLRCKWCGRKVKQDE